MNRITSSPKDIENLWARQHAEWRDTAQVASQWKEARQIDPRLLRHKVEGPWWELLAELGVTLLVTREYENLVMAMCVPDEKPSVSFLPMPHPSGLAIDRKRSLVYLASTRNPNQVFSLKPLSEQIPRLDVASSKCQDHPLVPVSSTFFPGCLYLHDLALVGDELHANAVGENAVVRLSRDGDFKRAWWPKCIDTAAGPVFGQNQVQLNSIATGPSLKESFFSASTDSITKLRPGNRNFPVDKRGVIFSGKTRTPVIRGLTRPHSARLHRRKLWVDNSGYGELGICSDGEYTPVAALPGWTRGLCFYRNIAFVGTSRVLPRFRQYAPGLDLDNSRCGVHAVDLRSAKVLASLTWPFGNQVFAVEWIPTRLSCGFPFKTAKRIEKSEKTLFYSFSAGRIR